MSLRPDGLHSRSIRPAAVLHTYSAYARGIDLLNTAYNYLDLVPEGRDEGRQGPQFWVRRHDEYDVA
jgi:predicted dithiol-disulfide oxidoreductase (DUF899 family)